MGYSWWLNCRESTSNGRRCGFHPWVGNIPWRRKWQPTPIFLPGKSHGQRSLVGYSYKRVGHELGLNHHHHTYLIYYYNVVCYIINISWLDKTVRQCHHWITKSHLSKIFVRNRHTDTNIQKNGTKDTTFIHVKQWIYLLSSVQSLSRVRLFATP